MPENYDFFQHWLEDIPEAAYYSAEPFQGGFAPTAQRYWQGQYGNIQNQYMGELGKQLRAGQAPTKTFTDFLGDYPWTERYTAMGPRLRPGGATTRYAPSVRRMY